jgi:hypothetical protein
VRGNRFRRVTFDSDEQRGGLLGHGSLLTVTSYPNRTSPVLRGKFLLDTILGTPPPPPPPDVPPLPDRGEGGKAASVRERLEQHRKNPACATCHAPMDPGASLENFDGVETGAPRARRAVRSMPPARSRRRSVQGLKGLRALLVSRRQQFVGAMTENVVGRHRPWTRAHDRPPSATIVRGSAASDYRWSSLLLGVVKSAPFQMRRARSEDSRPLAQAAGRR